MSTRRLTNLIQWGLIVLVAVMPFHAFLSVYLGSLSGHESIIQAWKEVLLAILAAAAIWLLIIDEKRRDRLRNPLGYLLAVLVVLAIVLTLTRHVTTSGLVFGAKTDLEFILALVLAWLVGDTRFLHRLVVVVMIGAAAVIGFGLLETFVLPANFLTHFGYGPHTIAPYQTLTSGFRGLRFPSTLGGANQLATYLILPLCLALAIGLRHQRRYLLIIPFGLIVLFVTYSRSGWIGAIVALAVTLVVALPSRLRRSVAIGGGLILLAAAGLIGLAAARGGSFQYIVLHSSLAGHDVSGSDLQHAQSLKNGLNQLVSTPLGHGLGTAGPATFHQGTTNIIENYYLQLGYELGVTGLVLFIAIVVLLIWRLFIVGGAFAIAVAAALIGISITALVLPAWTDSSTALIVWTLAGGILGKANGGERV